MKKTIITIVLACLLAAVLCACGDVDLVIDGVTTPAPEAVSFDVVYAGAEGTVTAEAGGAELYAGTEVTAHAEPAEGYSFFCWSVSGALADGGTPVSFAKDYTFPLEEDTTLYANFRGHDSVLVRYHANGGKALRMSDTTAEAASAAALEPDAGEVYWDDFSLAYFLYPNTPADMGYFTREGYTLVGYNTEPDGSGEFFNVGGKVFQDTDEVIELWCVWSEQSPAEDFSFEYDRTYSGWVVTAYSGNDEHVSIPSSYSGEPVVGVAAGAFTGNSGVTSLVFPSCMRFIRDYSCSDMENLTAIVLYDSLVYVSDASFEGDEALYTCFFSAATNPRYTNFFNNHTKKIELMYYYRDSERPKMIILGGSSTSYAVDAQQLESLLDRDYLVLNCGSNGANLFNMTSEWAMRYLKEDDFLLQIIEYSFWQLGGVQCTWETFRSFESCYNAFSWVRVSKYTQLFDCFKKFLDARQSQAETTYEDYVSSLAGTTGYYDNQGTLTVVTRPNGSDTFWQGRNIGFYAYDESGLPWFYDFMAYYCNVQYWKLDQLGVDYAMAFTPLNRNSLYDWQTDQMMEEWEDYLAEKLNITIISDLQENILEPAIFFDDDYHLAAPARADYTARLAEDLNAYFASADLDAEGE